MSDDGHDQNVDVARIAALALLRDAGLSPPPEELDAVIANYAGFRILASRLYTVADTNYELPAITFDTDAPTP